MRADDRELWQKNGHRLKTLGEVGRGLWMDWSATSDKFDPNADSNSWNSFKPTHTSYKAIFTDAQKLGWVNPMSNDASSNEKGLTGNNKSGNSFVRVSIADVFTNPPEPQKYIWGERIPYDALTLLAAHGGTGKSTFALQLSAHLATNTPFLGLATGEEA
jgi:predicted ATP-dependent serine protease